MSLVNQMLRDLEGRQAAAGQGIDGVLTDIGAVEECPAPPVPRRPRLLATVLLGVTAVAVLGEGSLHDVLANVAPLLRATPASVLDVVPERQLEHANRQSGTANASATPSPEEPSPSAAGRASAASTEPHGHVSSPDGSTAQFAGVAPAVAPVVMVAMRAEGLRLDWSLMPQRARGTPSAAIEVVGEDTAADRRPRPATVGDAAAGSSRTAPVATALLSAELNETAARFNRAFETGQEAPVPPVPAVTRRAAVVAESPRLTVRKPVQVSAAERADAFHADARQALAHGRPVAALAPLAEALRLEPTHHDARQLLATLLIRSARLPEALQVLEAAPPDSAAAQRLAGLRARVLMELDRDAEALALLDENVTENSANDLLALHAALMQRMGDHAGASAAYRRMLEREPGNGVWWMGLGISLEAMSQFSPARAAYLHARTSEGLRADLLGFVEGRLANL